MTDEPPAPQESDSPTPAAIAATEHPVQITVGLIHDDRVPDGMVCMGSYRNGRLVARSVLPPEAWGQIDEYGVFDEPVQIVLVARAAPPGLQCQLYAMIPLPDDEDDEPEEPWSASVPGAAYESTVEDEAEGDAVEAEDESAVAPIPLGNIVRYERDRVHPESLPLEAVDVLRRIIDGDTSEVVDRALADLLGL
ncbi:MAG TPA: hypothetical protein VFN08_13260 [Gemmatimonadales bacterium]|jgi:hypothetical protein|nr:hypothetical protein [Gemmatimonadales bacterium]